MCGNQKFFLCKHCGNLTGLIHNSGVPMICCGEKMTELDPNTVEASAEKHLPLIEVTGSTVRVRVGSAPHPAEEAHHIAFVYLETDGGGQRKCLKRGCEPEALFCLTPGETALAAFAYCNLHGLWKTQLSA